MASIKKRPKTTGGVILRSCDAPSSDFIPLMRDSKHVFKNENDKESGYASISDTASQSPNIFLHEDNNELNNEIPHRGSHTHDSIGMTSSMEEDDDLTPVSSQPRQSAFTIITQRSLVSTSSNGITCSSPFQSLSSSQSMAFEESPVNKTQMNGGSFPIRSKHVSTQTNGQFPLFESSFFSESSLCQHCQCKLVEPRGTGNGQEFVPSAFTVSNPFILASSTSSSSNYGSGCELSFLEEDETCDLEVQALGENPSGRSWCDGQINCYSRKTNSQCSSIVSTTMSFTSRPTSERPVAIVRPRPIQYVSAKSQEDPTMSQRTSTVTRPSLLLPQNHLTFPNQPSHGNTRVQFLAAVEQRISSILLALADDLESR